MGLPRIRRSRSAAPASRSRGDRSGTRSQSRSSQSKSKRKKKISILGGLGAGLLGALGSLFGGGLAKGSTDQSETSGGGGGARGSGKANYGPLPSFSIQSKTVRKYNNPTLATISMQMVTLLKEMGLVESALMAQFKQQQFAYTENARVQREINTESRGTGFVPFVAPDGEGPRLGSLSIKQLNDSYLKFSTALDDATEALNNMDCSCDGDIDVPLGIVPPTPDADSKKKPRKTDKNIKPYQRVAKAEALTKSGNVKPGYVARKDSLGRTYYIRQGGIEGAIRRKAPSLGRFIFGRQSFDFTDTEIKRLTQKGYKQSGLWWRGPDGQPVPKDELVKAAKSPVGRVMSSFAEKVTSTVSNIVRPLTEKVTSSRAFQTARRVSKSVVTGIKSFASKIKGLASWAQAGVDEVFERLKNTKAAAVYEKLVKSKGFNRIAEAIKRNSGVIRFAAKLAALALWIYMCWEYGVELYNVYKNRKSLSYKQISDQVTDILTRAFYDVGITGIAMLVGSLVGSAVAPVAGTLLGILVGAVVGYVADWLATATGIRERVTNALAPYIKKTVDWITEQYAKRVNGEEANLNAPPPRAQPLGLTQTSNTGEGTVPFRRPVVASSTQNVTAALGATSNKTVNELINETATRVGVEPSLMTMIASENAAFDPSKRVQNVNGSEIFKLTPQQWSSLVFRYGPRYPELYAGINDPKAATTAGALLIKDSQDFLTKNNIPTSPLSLYGSYLFGFEGLRRLLESQPSEIASSVLPEAALVRPELFKDAGGNITTGGLVQRLYNRTLPEQQRNRSPQGVPAVPPATTPRIAGLTPQQNDPTPRPSGAPSSGGITAGLQNVRAAASSMTSSGAPAPTAAPAGPDSSNAQQAAPSAQQAAPEPSSTYGVTAELVPPSPTSAPGAVVDERSRELENAAMVTQTGAEQPTVIQTQGSRRRPEILPSSHAGYTGTGNVPDPTYVFMDQYEYQFRFKSSPVLATTQTSWA